MNFGLFRTYMQMMKYKLLEKTSADIFHKVQRVLAIGCVGLLTLPETAFAKPKNSSEENSKQQTATVKANYNSQTRHAQIETSPSFADGIKIKRDLFLLDQVQEQREIDEHEIPADDLYGQIWDNRYVNSYGSLTNIPDTFRVNLEGFVMPTSGRVTSHYGPRGRRHHYGIDLKVNVGDTIYAAFDGKVRVRRFERRGYGYFLAVRHPNGLETVYAHLSKFLVLQDENVKAGQPIALGGNTGRSTGPHLHFEVRFLGKAIDPTRIIDFENEVCHQDEYLVDARSFSSLRAKGQLASKKAGATNKYTKGEVNYHRVRKGDTLEKIARLHGTTIKKLCTLNKITTRTTLRIGQTIRLS